MLPESARVAVVSPSGVFEPARLERGLELLRSWGYRPQCLPGVGSTFRYLAGTDGRRLDDLVAALTGPWDAVWMARGGYGLTRLLDRIPWDELQPVPFLGFSDATALLNPLAERGLPAVHAPVLHSVADLTDDASRAHLRALLRGESLAPIAGRTVRSGFAEGTLAGGNVCVLAAMCGTRWQFRGKGRIVVLEEVGEAPYKVDRLLTQLVSAGCFDGAAGFALGTFLGPPPPEGADWSVLDVVTDILAPFGVPILADLPIGHGPGNFAIPFGVPACISGERLVIEDGR
jgi:muramoyltetrapeptide carboxypeptidase